MTFSNTIVSQCFADVFACAGNVQVGIYRLGAGMSPELCPSDCEPNPFLRIGHHLPETNEPEKNPFLSSNQQIETVWVGRGFMTAKSVKNDREKWGKIDTETLEVMIPRVVPQLDTGLWVYIESLYVENIQGGEIMTLTRHLPTIYKFSVDTSKPVPFLPTAVGFDDWKRGVQV